MNYRGSYRKLLGNSKSAMVAAIEVYNKPSFQYRDECAVILLLNAWELVLKALLSKSKRSIFYRKKRGQTYRTLSWQDAFLQAKDLFPPGFHVLAVERNLELVGTYRDNAVHFYNNADGFGIVTYALAQTCIKNFRDLLEQFFDQRLEDEINWQLLPLGVRPPIDLVSYMSAKGCAKQTDAVRQFLAELSKAADEVKAAGEDTGRLLTVFNVKLESVKKIGDVDVIVGVQAADGTDGPLAIIKRQDPNISHPLRQKEIVERIATLHGRKFTPPVFQAIVWRYKLKDNPQYCWMAKEGILIRYSNDVVAWIRQLSCEAVEAATNEYRQYIRSRAKSRKGETV